jgi:catechol 2,3-dioxygenase-like lactoylglutathione lyase family enzyme
MPLTEPLGVGLVAKDPALLVRFYCDVFGFNAVDPITFAGHGTVHRLRSGRSFLRIFEPVASPAAVERRPMAAVTGIRYLTLVVDDLAATLDACRAFSLETRDPTPVGRGLAVVTIEDPEGNAVEIQGPLPG